MNIFDLPTLPLAHEVSTILEESDTVRIERIISTGQTSDWYDQEEAEFVVLLEGHAELAFENEMWISLNKGDTLLIHPHQKHQVTYTSSDPPCIWLCIFYPGGESKLGE